MDGIRSFLSRYLDFAPPEKVITRNAVKALEDVLGVKVDEERVSVRSGIVSVATDGILKSEIALHKARVIARLRELAGNTVTDIR
jgi:hypothetical protein